MASSPFLSENFIFGVYVPSAVIVFGVAVAASDYLPYALLAPLLLGTYQFFSGESKGTMSAKFCDDLVEALLIHASKW